MPSDRSPQFVTFKLGYSRVRFLASRPNVISVVTSASLSLEEGYFEFQGTQLQLNQAGVGNEGMFAGIGPGMQRTRIDEYGDRYMLARRHNHWTLGLRMTNSGCKHLPSDLSPLSSPWWIKHGGAAEAATATILRRFAHPPGAEPRAPKLPAG